MHSNGSWQHATKSPAVIDIVVKGVELRGLTSANLSCDRKAAYALGLRVKLTDTAYVAFEDC